MTTPLKKPWIVTGALAGLAAVVSLAPLGAAPAGKSKATPASTKKAGAPGGSKAKAPASTVKLASVPAQQRFMSMETIKRLQKDRQNAPIPVLQPTWEGVALKRPMRDLLTEPSFDSGAIMPAAPPSSATLLAQAGGRPRPLPPAPVSSVRRPAAPRPVAPRWVRYPLEFQLCGIGLGTKAVDKDRYNRIDRYGLFALHGNPTAVVVPAAQGGAIGVNQQPPEVAALFPADQGGGMPDWASAVTVSLDNNHVQWLYRRDTYSMGFVVDRLGFVDAIVVAGVQSNIARTQMEDPVHTVKLGDDLRKVLFRYGYPDTIETYTVGVAGTTVNAPAGAGGAAPAPAPGGAPGAEAPGAAAGAAAAGNNVYRTFEVRYEQSYNVVFTLRNNRVVRMYIFGDPDFFNERRRQNLRGNY